MATKPREILFTGAVPLRPAAKVFETLVEHVGALAPRIPDGEQIGWLGAVRRSLADNAALEEAREVKLNGRAAEGMMTYRLKPGCTPQDLKLGPYGYADNALTSYKQFKELKDAGRIPPGTRLQVTLPGPGTSTYFIEVPPDPLLRLGGEALLREVEDIVRAIPAEELAIQLDIAMEAEHEEWLRRPSAFNTPIHEVFDWTLDQMADSVAWLANQIPAEVELGFHICSIWHHWPDSGQDNAVLVDAANALSERIHRPLGYIHIPLIPEHDQPMDYAPLKDLKLHPETTLYLGLVNLADGLEGGQRRIALAEQVVPDFGIGFFCGLGGIGTNTLLAATLPNPGLRRATPESLGELLDLHRALAER